VAQTIAGAPSRRERSWSRFRRGPRDQKLSSAVRAWRAFMSTFRNTWMKLVQVHEHVRHAVGALDADEHVLAHRHLVDPA